MPLYRIYRIKETPRESFRWAPHTGGEAVVKFKDYDASRTVDAPTPYAAWKLLVSENDPLHAGDLLEVLSNCEAASNDAIDPLAQLLIAKYIGFEPAKWFIPEPRRADDRTEVVSFTSTRPAVSPAQEQPGR